MNLRQKAKKLKQQNAFLHHIINNDPELKRLYNQWQEPMYVTPSYKPLKKYKSVGFLPPDKIHNDDFIKYCKDKLAMEIMDGIKPFIKYEIYMNRLTMEATIYVAEND